MQIQWLKGFMCRTQTSHVGSLTMVFPCVVDNDSVLRQLNVACSFICSVIVGVIDTYRNSDSEFDLICGLCGSFLFHLFIIGACLFHHLRKREYFRGIT